jgi:hypothetical protein
MKRSSGSNTSLPVTREDFYIGCALIGVLAAAHTEPDQRWVAEWAVAQGRLVAARALETRKATSGRGRRP